jgi:YidC/Oxa1 family membrane protein insertase
MTIVFTFMFYNMPSGLNIYWIFSTIFGMLQQWFMIRRFQNNPKILKKS